MSLSEDRTRAYTLGALTGAFAALAVVADERRRALFGTVSLICGALAVVYEERADRMSGYDGPAPETDFGGEDVSGVDGEGDVGGEPAE